LQERVNRPTQSDIELIPPDYFKPLDVGAAFSRSAPLEVDAGCGEGSFLAALAAQHPEHNFLGIERLLGRVRKTCRRVANRQLDNVRVLRLETTYAVKYLLPAGSVAVFHVAFPDPWPKRKHWRRRLINDPFLDTVHTLLAPGGELRLTTDDGGYFAHMQLVCLARRDFTPLPWPEDPDYPQTDFEKGFREQGLPIHRLLLQKV
jgi:tRNA (guanine-N7-)-methyltransferase